MEMFAIIIMSIGAIIILALCVEMIVGVIKMIRGGL